MKKTVQKIPFLRLTVAFAAGIIIGSQFPFSTPVAAGFTAASFILLSVLNRFYKFSFSSAFGVAVNLFFIFLGITIYSNHNQIPDFHKSGVFTATVTEAPVEKKNSYQSVLEIQTIVKRDSIFNSDEKILAYLEKTDVAGKLKPGSVVLFERNPQVIENNGNPFEFDYKNYLARKNIFRQIYLSQNDWTTSGIQPSFSLKVLAEKVRLQLLDVYREQQLGENELNILSALTLGYKRELDPETKRVFTSAGAMHVLAVSGLHVGIIYLILNFLFGFLRRQKTGKLVFIITVVSALWIFAFITGLSPSVSRAATMFTFVVIGSNLRRQVNIYNSLAGSAIFLLLINPNNLFEVGFQLSYSAVFGIVFLQPKLEKLTTFEREIPKYFWQLLTVSVAAQIATFPFSIFYFNQFPTYFWISNLFVIPAVIILIPAGFSLLIFHGVPILGSAISIFIDKFIGGLYYLLQLVDSLPFSVREVVISPLELVFLFGLLISTFTLIAVRKKMYLKAALVFLLLLATTSLAIKADRLNQKQLIIYNDTENTIVHLILGGTNYIISEQQLDKEDYSMRAVESTIKKLRLIAPRFLTTDNKFEDGSLLLENNLLVFEDKVILLHPEIIPQNIQAEIVVNPKKMDNINDNTTVVSGTKYYNSQELNSRIFRLRNEGAFIKKW